MKKFSKLFFEKKRRILSDNKEWVSGRVGRRSRQPRGVGYRGARGALNPLRHCQTEKDNLSTVAPLDFRTFLRADSKKEAKFTTDKSSKDQLSEGKAVRDLLFGPSTMVWGDFNREGGSQEENFSWYFLTRKEIFVVEIPTPLMTRDVSIFKVAVWSSFESDY